MSHTKGTLTRAFVTGSVLVAALVSAPAAEAQTAQARTVHDEVVRLTNAERQKAGCPPVTPVAELGRAAQNHAVDMAVHDFMGHTGSDGSTMRARAERSGYTGWRNLAENVGAGFQTANEVVAKWMGSPGHRANILNCRLKDIGVGHATNPSGRYGVYWAQDFGTR